MAPTKLELQEAHSRYHAQLALAQSAYSAGRLFDSIGHAVAALDHVDGMMQYDSRFLRRDESKEVSTVLVVEIILALSPVLLWSDPIERVAALLKERRRVERDTTADLGAKVDTARRQLSAAYRLWRSLDQPNPPTLGDIGQPGEGDWHAIAKSWQEFGLLASVDTDGVSRLVIRSCIDQSVRGKCPECAVIVRGPMDRLLDRRECPKCRKLVTFVIFMRDDRTGGAGV